MIRKIYRALANKKQKIVRSMKKKVPVYIPVLQSNLLKGRCALITGGTRGIGFEIAKAYLKAGASVIVTGHSQERITKACEDLKQFCEDDSIVSGVVLDNTDCDSFDNKFEEVLKLAGERKIDILVNNAGVNGLSQFGKITAEDYDKTLNTNLRGAFMLSQVVAKYMKENKVQGNILNICSSSSLRPAVTPYTLSKWGLRGLTLGLAKTLIPYGIVVNGLAPGATATEMLVKDGYDGIELDSNPSGRFAEPVEMANMAVVLVSPLCRMAVGNILYMTGGRTDYLRRYNIRLLIGNMTLASNKETA